MYDMVDRLHSERPMHQNTASTDCRVCRLSFVALGWYLYPTMRGEERGQENGLPFADPLEARKEDARVRSGGTAMNNKDNAVRLV